MSDLKALDDKKQEYESPPHGLIGLETDRGDVSPDGMVKAMNIRLPNRTEGYASTQDNTISTIRRQ